MKRRAFAAILAVIMLMSLIPTTVLADENEPDEETALVCAHLDGCTENAHAEGCPLYVAPAPEADPADVPAENPTGVPDEPDEDPAEGEGDTTVTDPEQEEPVEEPTAAEQLQARIDVLPGADALAGMDTEEQAKVYAEVCAISDAIKGLTDEETALNTAKLEAAAAFFAQQIMTLGGDDTEETVTLTSGNCGAPITEDGEITDAVKWSFDSTTGILTISGSGEMVPNFDNVKIENSGVMQIYGEKITKIVIQDGVTYLSANLTRNTKNVEISIPASVTDMNINLEAYSDSSRSLSTFGNTYYSYDTDTEETKIYNIAKITVSPDNQYYMVENGVLFSKDRSILYRYTDEAEADYIVPDGVKTIAAKAFARSAKLKSLTLNSGLITIGGDCFDKSVNLSGSMTIPATVKGLGYSSFSQLPNVTELVFLADDLSGYNRIIGNTSDPATGITKIVLSEKTKSIPDNLFANMANLTAVTLPSSLETIGTGAFERCKSLKSIDLAAAPGLKTISVKAFNGAGLESIVIPDSVENVGQYAFYNCSNLKTVTIPESSQLEKIESYTFANTGIEAFCLPSSIKTIDTNAFFQCAELKTVTIPKNSQLQTIGTAAFCVTKIESIYLPSGVEAWGQYAFGGNRQLIAVDLTDVANNITTGGSAFYNTGHGVGDDVNKTDNYKLRIYYFATEDNALKTALGSNSKYSIYAVTNGGTFPEGTTFESEKLAAPIMDNYKFEGWYTQNGVENNAWGNAVNSPTAGQTYYAKWAESSYTVDDSLDFGTLTYGADPVSKTVTVSGGENPSVTSVTDSDSFSATYDGVTVTITPNSNLPVGTYSETIIVTTGDEATHNVTVTLTVTKATLTAPELSDYTATATSITVTAPTLPTGASKVQYSIDDGSTWQDINVFSGLTADTSYSVIAKFVANDSGNYVDSASSTALSVKTDAAPSDTPSPDPGNSGSSSGGSHSSSGSSSASATYTVTVDSTKNGAVAASPRNAKKDDTVTLTVTPKDGYELDDLTVTDKNGKSIKVTEGKNGKFTFTMPAGKVTVEATFAKIAEQPKVAFVDVPTSAYYYDAVAWAVENGVTGGTTATTFSPNAPCTRAQAVTFLWRAAGSPAPKTSVNPFADVSAGAYYYEAVLWAVENGITAGTSATTFNPDTTCTRAQIVTFLFRAGGADTTGANPFADVADSAYYAGAVAWAVSGGITTGTTATTFSPSAPCTRAQIVTFLYRAEA